MAFAPHTLMAFGGTLGTQPYQDIWQCGIRLMARDGAISGGGLNGPLADPNGFQEGIAAGLQSWFTRTAASGHFDALTVSATLAYLKVNNIGADGKYSDPAHVNTHNYSTPAQGTYLSVLPPFLSAAITWKTAGTGRARKGRIFLPLGMQAAGSGYITPTAQADYVKVGQALLSLIRGFSNAGTIQAVPVVASRIDASYNEITGMRVGNVVDVQRRRKNAYAESYLDAPLS